MKFNNPIFLFSVSCLDGANNEEFNRLYNQYLNSDYFQVSGIDTNFSKDGKSFKKFSVYEVQK